MSHNYPYRRQLVDSSITSDSGNHSSADRRRHISADHQFYQPPQESFSSSSYSSSSSSSSRVAHWSQDSALSILNSCGLEPSDLALLAEMPEDTLTVESLPQVLKQIKGKRGTVRNYPPSSSSLSSSAYTSGSTRRPSTNSSSTSDWDHSGSQSIQYSVSKSSPLPELDRWGNPINFSCVANPPPTAPSSSSTSSSYTVDYNSRPVLDEYSSTGRNASLVSSQDCLYKSRPLDFGKTGRDVVPVQAKEYHYRPDLPGSGFGKTGNGTDPLSSQHQLSFSSSGRDKTARSSYYPQPGPSDYSSARLPEEPSPPSRCSQSEMSSSRSSSRPAAASMPSKREAQDFHGTAPLTYPHSCSLCAITVMSEKVWLKHINGPQHADGQLCLLQRFPHWDCRLEAVSRSDSQSERRGDEGRSAETPATDKQSTKPTQTTKTAQKKTSEKSKVVCVKFPAQSVDETYLRKLAEPFGKIVKVLMFPTLAFVELGSIDQAKDLVKFHANYPPTVNGEQMEFRLSNTFSFLQSSRVVSFIPAPSGEHGQSDLINIVKRFGVPLYTLFLPSQAFIEMKETSEAQKLVDYYFSNHLRINDDLIKVAFSGEYKSIMRVASAKRYVERPVSPKKTKGSSQEREERITRRGSRSRSREISPSVKKIRSKSRSREKSSRNRRTRTRSRSKETSSKSRKNRSRSKSREKSCVHKESRSRSRDKTNRSGRARTRSKSRSKSRDKSSRNRKTRTRSKSREKSNTETMPRSRKESEEKSSREKCSLSKSESEEKPVKTETSESRTETKSGSRKEPEEMPSREKSSMSKSRSEEKPVKTETSESRTDPELNKDIPEAETESSAEESDIEGMEVIGEDGENLHDEEGEDVYLDKESPAERTESPDGGKSQVAEEEADYQEEQITVLCDLLRQIQEKREDSKTAEKVDCPAGGMDSPEEDKELNQEGMDHQEKQAFGNKEEVTETHSEENEKEEEKLIKKKQEESKLNRETEERMETRQKEKPVQEEHHEEEESYREAEDSMETQQEEDEEPEFPIDLDSCITLDELEEEESDNQGQYDEHSDEERSDSSSQASRRSERLGKSETSERETFSKTQSRKTPEKSEKSQENEPEKSSERESSSRNTTKSQNSRKKSAETETQYRKSSEKSSDGNSPEKKPHAEKASKESSRVSPAEKTPSEKDPKSNQTEKDSDCKQTPEEEPSSESSPEKTLKRKGTSENSSVPEKKEKKVQEEERQSEPRKENSSSPDLPDSTRGPPKSPSEQKPAVDQREHSEVKVQEPSELEGGAAELQKPTKPVGTEFVRPVVGYFCNLCQVIYADEDEAKQTHCSSEGHYRRYQEKTGKDPWAS